jgi:hypothetical protein
MTHQFDTPILQVQQVHARDRSSCSQQRRWDLRQEPFHSQQKYDYREPNGQRC